MSSELPEPESRPPRAGFIILGAAALVVAILFFAGRNPPPQPSQASAEGTANAPATGPAPVNAPEVAANVPVASNSSVANTPLGNVPATGPPAGGATAALPSTPAPTLPPAGGRSDGLPPGHPEIPAEDAAQVGIQWLGGYCFYIHSPGGVAVVTDPFDPKAAGLPPPETGAHFVTVSEDSPLHANVEAIHEFQGEKREVLRGTGAQRGDLQITPVPLEPGKRWAYVIQAGPLRIAHLGALTKPLTPEQAARLGKVDVLMLPAGGQGLSPKDAVAVAQRVAPRLIVPMAYADPMMQGATARLLPLEKFVAASPFAVTQKDSDVTMVGRSDLPPSPEILALKFRR